MSRPTARPLAICLILASALLGGIAKAQPDTDAPNGKPQTLAPHRWTGAAPVSVLPEAVELTVAPKPYGGTPIDVTTFHYDNNRSGWNASETDLTPATVVSGKFVVLKKLKVDGSVLAQPLLVSNFTMPNTVKRDVLIVVTGLDSVYAFDANAFTLLWQARLGPAQSSTDVGCSDVPSNYGISGTPVILRSGSGTATIYLVAATEPAPYQFHHYLHALDLGTGLDVTPPVEIAASATLPDGTKVTFNPQDQWNRPALAAANGSIYVALGAHCDGHLRSSGGAVDVSTSLSGWLLKYDTSLKPLASFHTIGGMPPVSTGGRPNIELASIWMASFAPAIDGAGNVFVTTGNGDYTPSLSNFGESLLKLSPALSPSPVGSFIPPNSAVLNPGDYDLGSGGAVLLPPVTGQTAPARAVVMGKDPIIYLLDQSLDVSALVASYRLGPVGQNGVWGGPAYYDGPAGPEIFYQINSDILRSITISPNSPYLTAGPTGTTIGGYGGSTPVVTSNGSTPGTGIVWEVRRATKFNGLQYNELEAYNATTLGAPIYAVGIGGHKGFDTPLVANGRVVVGGERVVTIFGLAK